MCEHEHPSVKLLTITKSNKKEVTLPTCAACSLMLAGLSRTGCTEVNRG